MSSYLLFLETVINTIVSLLAAAIALFDPALHAVPQVERISLTRASYVRAVESGLSRTLQDVGALTARLRTGDPAQRVAAACELQPLGSEAAPAMATLVERLSDDGRAAGTVIAAFKDSEAAVRGVAAWALGAIGK
jgi:hypothetical protein